MRAFPRVARLALLLLAAAPARLPAQAASLKDIQRSIRERIQTEAGGSEQVYTKVDFSHCAATIQSRTLKQTSREVRLTTTFHLTTLEAVAAPGDSGFVVKLRSAGPGSALRQIEQVIDSGRVREVIRSPASFELSFPLKGSAELVRDGFARMATLCKSDDPLLRGAQD